MLLTEVKSGSIQADIIGSIVQREIIKEAAHNANAKITSG